MGDSHHHGFQPQLLSFGGAQHHVHHQFSAQASPAAASSHSRSRGGAGGEIVPATATPASHSRVRGGGGGEIVAVQGGHIVRSTGRKDRHSKVCTARGPRDRRVRLSAHTAIQFYDVQDRLGYDRPSKAVDWLIKNAKDAIDKLEVLPAWQPTANAAAAPPSSSTHPTDSAENSDDQAQAITVAHTAFDYPGDAGGASGGGGGFLPASLDSDSIADTIKSFFPMAGTAGGGEASSSTAAAHSSAMGFQSYTPDLLSRTGSHSQELRLSLQSHPDPGMFHHQHQQQDRSHGGNGSAQQALFPGYSFGGGAAMWGGEQAGQRMLPWNVADPGGGGSTAGGYLLQQAAHMQAAALAGQSQFLFQRGPLQSSNNQPSDRGWPETVEADNPMQHHGALSPAVFAPDIAFSGFRIPTRIQGDEDHNGGGNNGGDKPPTPPVSSASHH